MKFKNKIFRILCLCVAMAAAGIIVVFESLSNIVYGADSTAMAAMESTNYVTVEETKDYIAFEPAGIYNTGIIFYPGAAVEPESYAPLMRAIAEDGYLCVIAKMPFNYAFMEVNVADGIRSEFKKVADWYMAGHSLGGSMASMYAEENADQLRGVILLASYSTEDLKDKNLEVLSIYGTMDGILNLDNYEEYKSNLPQDMSEVVIEGGNHANFANYGSQVGDGVAEISLEDQQNQTVEAICSYLEFQMYL